MIFPLLGRSPNRLFIGIVCGLLTVCGCARHGGQDGGGGNAHVSSLEEVHTAIATARSLIVTQDPIRNVFVRSWMDWSQRSSSRYIVHPSRLFPKLKVNDTGEAQWNGSGVAFLASLESPPLNALASHPWRILDSGNCPSPDNNHADASVTKLALDGIVCISAANLQRIPASSLLEEVLGLLLHEAIHLGGGGEEEAQVWQKHFTEYFAARFGVTNRALIEPTIRSVLQDLLKSATEVFFLQFAEPETFDRRAYLAFGEMRAKIGDIPHFLDPVASALSLQPVRPEYFDNYTNSILWLAQDLISIDDTREQNTRPFSQIEIKEIGNRVRAEVFTIIANFDFYLKGIGESVCKIPDANIVMRDRFWWPNAIMDIVPPNPNCSPTPNSDLPPF